METIRLEVDEQPSVLIRAIGGDLRMIGRQAPQMEVQAPEEGKLALKKRDERLEIECRSNCLVLLPSQAQVRIKSVGGDVRITDLQGALEMDTVGGDLSLRRMGEVKVRTAGGDLQARDLEGDLSLAFCGGDAVVRSVNGAVNCEALGGDLWMREVSGDVLVNAGGDAALDLLALEGSQTTVQAGGDLSCRLPPEASATISLRAGGQVRLSGLPVTEESESGTRLQLGEGEAEIQLRVGGDAWLQTVAGAVGEEAFHLGDEITRQVESHLSGMDDLLDGLTARFGTFDADRIGDRVERFVRRAVRKSIDSTRRSERKARKAERRAASEFTSEADDFSEEGRTILRMLEAGKITGEQADKLLQALEGEL